MTKNCLVVNIPVVNTIRGNIKARILCHKLFGSIVKCEIDMAS